MAKSPNEIIAENAAKHLAEVRADGFRAGAEAMREQIAASVYRNLFVHTRLSVDEISAGLKLIRSLPIPEESR